MRARPARAAAAALAVLGPQATLERGYAIVRRAADGAIVRDPAEAPAGTRLAIRLARGELRATVDPERTAWRWSSSFSLVVAVVVLVVGIRVGMLLAPRIERWRTVRPLDEEPSAPMTAALTRDD